MDESTTMKKEWNYQIATFVACCFVLLVNLGAAVTNWLAFEDRKQLFAQMAALSQRIEVVERRTDTHTPLQPDQQQPP